MKRHYQLFLSWLAIIFWFSVIYYFSAQPNLKSEFKPLLDLILRKIAHMAEFFVLAYLFFRTYRLHGLPLVPALILSILSAVGGAMFDEWHQSFTSGRVASFKDVLIDGLGIVGFLGLKLWEIRK